MSCAMHDTGNDDLILSNPEEQQISSMRNVAEPGRNVFSRREGERSLGGGRSPRFQLGHKAERACRVVVEDVISDVVEILARRRREGEPPHRPA